jgi:hypothetical protein
MNYESFFELEKVFINLLGHKNHRENEYSEESI